jgi:hypothetical protein
MVVSAPCWASDPWIPPEELVSRLVARQAMPRAWPSDPHSVGGAGQQLLPPVLSAAVTQLSAPKPLAPLLRRRHLQRTCQCPGRQKHLLPRCMHASAHLHTAVRRTPPQPVRRLGWLGRPHCLQALHVLSIHVQQSIVLEPLLLLLWPLGRRAEVRPHGLVSCHLHGLSLLRPLGRLEERPFGPLLSHLHLPELLRPYHATAVSLLPTLDICT